MCLFARSLFPSGAIARTSRNVESTSSGVNMHEQAVRDEELNGQDGQLGRRE